MSDLRVTNLRGRTAGSAPTLPDGLVVTGIATFNNNVSIAGTLTYEDVTNVDAVGVITARSGIVVSAGGINAVGIVTTSTGLDDQSGGLTLDSWLYGGG